MSELKTDPGAFKNTVDRIVATLIPILPRTCEAVSSHSTQINKFFTKLDIFSFLLFVPLNTRSQSRFPFPRAFAQKTERPEGSSLLFFGAQSIIRARCAVVR